MGSIHTQIAGEWRRGVVLFSGHSDSNLLAQGLTVCWTLREYLRYCIAPSSQRNLRGVPSLCCTQEEMGLPGVTAPEAGLE